MEGRTISHYSILRKLGAGGMGEVYLAEDTTLNRKVAIKLLPPESFTDELAKKRLRREAQAAAALDHPNICTIYEVGEEDGRSFIVMQYVEGETLASKIQRKPLELGETLDIGAQIADALAEAHSHGIVHRDIKPQNIMITARNQARVLDFGLAKAVQEKSLIESQAETQSLLTEPGTVAGTVPYLSPEQIRGEALDTRSDIFSFGVTMYEMVSGRKPFVAESAAATASAILTKEPLPLARYAPDAPAELQRVVRKCLEKNREQRYQSARDLLIDLRNLEQDRESPTVLIAKASTQQPSKMRSLAFSAAAVAVLGLAMLATYLVTARDNAIDSLAVLPLVNGSADQNAEYLSDGITESLINSLSKLPKLRVIARTTVFRYKNQDVDPQKVGRDLGVRAVLTGRVVQRGDAMIVQADLIDVASGAQLWGEQYNRKFSDILAVQDEIAKQISEKLRLRLTGEEQKRLLKRYTDDLQAYQLYLKGRYFWNKRSEEGMRKSTEYFKQAVVTDPHYALGYVGLADAYATLSWYSILPPKEAFPLSEDAAKKALEVDDTLAEAHTSLAHARELYYWDWAGAEVEYQRAIALNPNYAVARYWYAVYLVEQGRTDEALAEIRRAQEVEPASPIINAGVGQVFYLSHRYDQSIDELRKTIDLEPSFFFPHLLLGWAYAQKGNYSEAIEELNKANQLEDFPLISASLGYTYAISNQRAAAIKILTELKAQSERRYISPLYVALIYTGLGDKDQAFAWLETAYQDRSVMLPWLRINPQFDSLRSDPRFADLLRRVGLSQ